MPAYRFPTEADLTPSPEELAKARKAAAAPGEDTAWGSGIGTVLGGALGALGLLVPGLGAVTIPAGAAAGGAIGSAIGGSVGNGEADKANETLDATEQERQRKIAEFKLQQEALAELEAAG